MRKDELVINIYRVNDKQGCLVVIVKGKKPFKILNVIDPLHFVGWIKQLSVAIDTGAEQGCDYKLKCANGTERVLKCSFAKQVVALEFSFKGQSRLRWKGSARDFGAAVDRMIAQLPKFFKILRSRSG